MEMCKAVHIRIPQFELSDGCEPGSSKHRCHRSTSGAKTILASICRESLECARPGSFLAGFGRQLSDCKRAGLDTLQIRGEGQWQRFQKKPRRNVQSKRQERPPAAQRRLHTKMTTSVAAMSRSARPTLPLTPTCRLREAGWKLCARNAGEDARR